MKSTPKVVPGAAPAMAQAGVGGYTLMDFLMDSDGFSFQLFLGGLGSCPDESMSI